MKSNLKTPRRNSTSFLLLCLVVINLLYVIASDALLDKPAGDSDTGTVLICLGIALIAGEERKKASAAGNNNQ